MGAKLIDFFNKLAKIADKKIKIYHFGIVFIQKWYKTREIKFGIEPYFFDTAFFVLLIK